MKKTLLTLVALLLAFAMCFSFVGCNKDDDDKDSSKSAGSPKAVVEKAVKYMFEDNDCKAYCELVHEDVLKGLAEENDQTVDEYIKEGQDALDMMYGSVEEYGGTMDIDYKVGEAEDSDNADKVKEAYEEKYGLKVEDVKQVDVEITINVEVMGEKQSNTQDSPMTVCKIDGKWYGCPDESFQ